MSTLDVWIAMDCRGNFHLKTCSSFQEEAHRLAKQSVQTAWELVQVRLVSDTNEPIDLSAFLRQRSVNNCDEKRLADFSSLDDFNFWRQHNNVTVRAFQMGQKVQKKSGASWRGTIVGYYSTKLTPIGYAVESLTETGSVQIYPEAALEPMVVV